MSLELVYFTGGPREKVLAAILDAGHRITRLYANDPLRWSKVEASIALAREANIPVSIVTKKSQVAALAEEVHGKLCLSVGFNYLFPRSFISAARVCLNVHGSLLPNYKGARTLAWAIEMGETKSGVTIHVVDEGMDTGPILLQREFPLSLFETTRSLARKTGAFEPHVVVEALELFESKGAAVCKPQGASKTVIWPNRTPVHSQLDPSRPLLELVNKIRAADADHYPAHFYIGGEKVCVKLWRPEKPDGEDDLV